MISYTTIAFVTLAIAAWRLGWFLTICIAVAAVSLPFMGQFGATVRDAGVMLDQAVAGVGSSNAVGLILPALGWG
jgi:hypothetical protein